MATGLLQVSGTLDTSQFWPAGESDGDTVKVAVDGNSFTFRPFPTAPFRTTHVFEGARVRGRGTKNVIDTKGRIDVRLQGIDARQADFRGTDMRMANLGGAYLEGAMMPLPKERQPSPSEIAKQRSIEPERTNGKARDKEHTHDRTHGR